MTENVKWTGVWYYCDTGAIENLGKELEKAEAHIARLETALMCRRIPTFARATTDAT